MDIKTYLQNKKAVLAQYDRFKSKCAKCWQPDDTCICKVIEPFFPHLNFVILTHPIEASKRIASGRIAHACLNNSYFFRGYDFLKKKVINDLINDNENQCFVLYPSLQAIDISASSKQEITTRFNFTKNIHIFVIDGTWGNANKMLRLSPNISTLPKIKFLPSQPSNFKVRKQPKDFCLSTLEAINEITHLLSPYTGLDYNMNNNPLIEAFTFLVDDQLKKIDKYKKINGGLNYRSGKNKKL